MVGADNNLSNYNLYLISPTIIPDAGTQVMLNESIQNTLPYHLILGQLIGKEFSQVQSSNLIKEEHPILFHPNN